MGLDHGPSQEDVGLVMQEVVEVSLDFARGEIMRSGDQESKGKKGQRLTNEAVERVKEISIWGLELIAPWLLIGRGQERQSIYNRSTNQWINQERKREGET